ncbi:hypothetical protein BC939DRAFT_459862 [Gamsiella multidivaricata]|uniref:uncharacterized protein n=1 Tax=Gamsiella multidivaricata TaxID=101098 RepID=UPI00221FC060|nr:uncharacterized protein BC939DRAFT_459862 [Gamsiella multidivaricata]KAG0368153.1 hypothetical protein BGZ54_002548 [Gamsiella multidivaricata]KAI7819471.1 hypothetical protein BC939DRAFT_459862 [Gamsiella multidivaricata]
MRLLAATSLASLLALASTIQAQDANCTAVYGDYAPSVHGNGVFQKCYTDQAYNAALVSQGATPNYRQVLNQVCSPPLSPTCSRSSLLSGTVKFMAACNASIDAEAANGNILQTGKIALEIFFAEPIHIMYCALDPNAIELPPPAVNPPAYCLANPVVGSPNSRFITNLALYLTSGTIRASQRPFFESLDRTDTCSICSQRALNATVGYLATNLMPRIASFYTSEFVQYWTNLVPVYNALCKTSIIQTWPKGTLNESVTTVSTGSLPAPAAPQPTIGGSEPIASVAHSTSNGATSLSASTVAIFAVTHVLAVTGLSLLDL